MLRLPIRARHLPPALFGVAFVALIATLGAAADRSAGAAGTCGSARSSLDGEEQAAVAQVNAYRAEHGLGELRVSALLTGIASWMLDDAASSGRVEHTDSLGRSAYARAVACGYAGGAGENLAAGGQWDSAADAVGAWKASAGHNANLLSRYYTEVGVARLHRPGSAYGWYWAMEFGSNAPTATPAASTATQLPPTPTATATAPPTPTATPSATPIASANPARSPAAPKAAGVTAQSASPAEEPTANSNRPWRVFLPAY